MVPEKVGWDTKKKKKCSETRSTRTLQVDVRIFTEEERFGSWMAKSEVEKTGQKWSVHWMG